MWRRFEPQKLVETPIETRDDTTLRVRPAGLEPATHGLEIRCSIQLSYERFSDGPDSSRRL